MASRYSASAVISYFTGDDTNCLGESICDGSDDDLGMEEWESDETESNYEPLDGSDQGNVYTTQNIY